MFVSYDPFAKRDRLSKTLGMSCLETRKEEKLTCFKSALRVVRNETPIIRFALAALFFALVTIEHVVFFVRIRF